MLIFSHVLWSVDPLKECVAAATENGGKEASPQIFGKQEKENTGGWCGPEGHSTHSLRKMRAQLPTELKPHSGFSTVPQVAWLVCQRFLRSEALVAQADTGKRTEAQVGPSYLQFWSDSGGGH